MPTEVTQILRVVEFLLWAAVALYSWQSNKHRATRESVDEVRSTVESTRKELAVLQERVRHVPETSDWIELKGALSDCASSLRAQEKLMDAMSSRMTLIESYLKGR